MRTVFRIIVGIFLIISVIPPASVGVVNLFVLLPAFLGIFILLLPLIRAALHRLGARRAKNITRIFLSLLILGALTVCTELGFILAGAVPEIRDAPDDAVVIVLGAQVKNSRPSLILSGRIKAAAEYLAAHPESVCIASGGKGSDEDISEAKCIRDTLVSEYDIDSARIILEDRSLNTNQNMANCAAVIAGKGLSADVVVITDGFHMFRAKLLAGRKGLTPYSCPVPTDIRLLPAMYIREFVGIPKTLLFDR